jgi:hypothetical protein
VDDLWIVKRLLEERERACDEMAVNNIIEADRLPRENAGRGATTTPRRRLNELYAFRHSPPLEWRITDNRFDRACLLPRRLEFSILGRIIF